MLQEDKPFVCYEIKIVDDSLCRLFFHSFYAKGGRAGIACSPIFNLTDDALYQFCGDMLGVDAESCKKLGIYALDEALIFAQVIVSYDGNPYQITKIAPNLTENIIKYPKVIPTPKYWYPVSNKPLKAPVSISALLKRLEEGETT
jgi:hypothetical protein